VVRLVRRDALAHGALLRLELAPALPVVLGDRVQLQQVLINLVINAIQAMASVTDRPRDLWIRSQQRDAGHVLVAVTDSGSGIDAKSMNELFKAFYTTKPSGMGMGLSICRSIIEAHGGQVSAANNAGPGATFQFTLPIGR
jgi:signal transduction histidine kinase